MCAVIFREAQRAAGYDAGKAVGVAAEPGKALRDRARAPEAERRKAADERPAG